ncbi:MAG: hypothetical protein GX345_02335 [Clostridiales bacterium]|nr:hypothetical protein [Clostridiales bacterium]
MSKIKKTLALLLSLVLIISLLAACTGGGKDAEGESQSPEGEEVFVSRKKAKVGDKIHFGKYEQDKADEDLGWLVLKKEGGKLLLISDKVIDLKSYHSKRSSVTWETSDLRLWLNDEFLNKAFSSQERKRIVETNIKTNDNEKYNTPGGNEVKDKVFLLSLEEAEEFFEEDLARRSAGTAFAEEKGLKLSPDQLYLGMSPWWLRSPGRSATDASYVNVDGRIYDTIPVDNAAPGVRPLIWVKS